MCLRALMSNVNSSFHLRLLCVVGKKSRNHLLNRDDVQSKMGGLYHQDGKIIGSVGARALSGIHTNKWNGTKEYKTSHKRQEDEWKDQRYVISVSGSMRKAAKGYPPISYHHAMPSKVLCFIGLVHQRINHSRPTMSGSWNQRFLLTASVAVVVVLGSKTSATSERLSL